MDEGTTSPQDTAGREQRAAARSSLMLRAAKLLCHSGEYVCIVRDVSAGGVRLRLFHEPPPETHLFLELGNQERYAIARVWARDDHAGYRFSCAIDVDRFIAERGDSPRRPLRLTIQSPATIHAEGAAGQAMLVDVSQHGACVDASRQIALRQQVRLEIAGLPPRVGFVRWRKGYRHGLVFQQGLGLAELAGQAIALQPFASDPGVQEEPLPVARRA